MKRNKLIGTVLAIAQLAAFSVFPSGIHAEKADPAVAVYNDGDASEWEAVNSNGEVSQITEDDGNKWVRLTTKTLSGASVPRMVYDLGDNKIKFEKDKKIIIETRLRVHAPDAGGRAAMHYNVFDEEVKYGDTTQIPDVRYNHLAFWQLYSYGSSGGIDFGYAGGVADNQTKLDWLSGFSDPLVASSIFTVKVVWDKEADKADFYVTDSSGEKKGQSNDMGYKSLKDYLENISISNVVAACQYIDVDYLKISVIAPNAEAKLAGAGEQGEIIKAEKIDVKFNYPINESTLDGNLSIVDESGNSVDLETIRYDNSTYTASLVPDTENHRLPNGSYKVVVGSGIRTADIYADYASLGVSANIPVKAAEFEFVYFDSEPPYISGTPYIEGDAHTGARIVAKYTYAHGDNVEEDKAATKIEWYVGDSEDGTFTKTGVTGEEFELSEEYSDKFIKFTVMPVDKNGLAGKAVESAPFAGPSKPIAQNVVISGVLVKGKDVTIGYDFYDANGDAEGNTKYKWYISDALDGTFDELESTARKLTITDDMSGKYLKASVLPVAENAPYEGSIAYSEAYGPVLTDMRDATNLVLNGGFESGTTQGFSSVGNLKIEAVKDAKNAHSGEYYMKASGKGAASDGWGYSMYFNTHTAYLISVYAKMNSDTATSFTPYSWGGSREVDYDGIDYPNNQAVGGDKWYEVSGVLTAFNAHKALPTIVSWGSSDDVCIDDVYIGKLAISDIEAPVPESVEIPLTGETKVNITPSAVLNQLGNGVGMLNSSTNAYPYVKYAVPSGVSGVRIEDEYDSRGTYKSTYLIVDDLSNAGKLELSATCDPEKSETNAGYRYWGVEPFTKTFSIELKGNGNTTPRITSSKLKGTVNAGDTLSIEYTFYQLYQEEDKSEITWYYSPDATQEYTKLEGESGKTYTVAADKAGGFFKAMILPKTETETGTAVTTNIVGPALAPTASNIKITGKSFIGETLTAMYDWYDFNDDERGEDVLKWLRADSENGEYKAIDGAVNDSYVLTAEDVGKYIKFEVTPVSTTEPKTGETVRSAAFAGPKAPEANNLQITKNKRILTGSYDYYQADGAPEGKSTYRWLVNGNVVSTDITYVLPSDSKMTVTFEVTPVSSKEPYQGKTVSISKSFGSSGSSGSSGGGKSGSIGGTAADVINKNGELNPNVVPSIDEPNREQTPADAFGDIKTHWGYEAIKWAVNNEIMEGITDTAFEPDSFATRRSIIEYLSKILGWDGTEYTGIFEDVDGDFANILQTFVDKGVISRDTKFRPDDGLSRQELCKILALSLGITSENTQSTAFSDNSEIGQWAVPYVNAMYESKFVLGVGDNRFNPKGKVTRAQMATLMMRVDETVKASGTETPADDAALTE